jgi:sec-independent protein translocase protein TatB
VFGFSIFEVVLIGVVTLVAVGPKRLPGMLKNFGAWMRKLRKMTLDVRQQTGIDDILRQEGIHGGLNELRSLVRGGAPAPAPPPPAYRPPDPYASVEIDLEREYPSEGPDANGALPDDLLLPSKPRPAPPAPAPAAPAPQPAPNAEAPAADAAQASTSPAPSAPAADPATPALPPEPSTSAAGEAKPSS